MIEVLAGALAAVLFLLVLALVCALFLAATICSGAPFVASRAEVISAMCELAELKKGDRVVDFGCGNGAVVVYAARQYDVHAIGVELNPLLVLMAGMRARFEGVSDRTRFIRANIFVVDLPPCDVAFLYLLPKATAKIAARLANACTHARIISNAFVIPGRAPSSTRICGKTTIYRYDPIV